MYAQTCTNTSRLYANFQTWAGTSAGLLATPGKVVDDINAADTDPSSYSTLSANTLIGSSEVIQYLEFTNDGSHASKISVAGNKITKLKISLPAAFVGVSGTVEVGTFINLNTTAKTATRSATYNGPIAGLLSGDGAIELDVTSAAPYNGVYVRLSATPLAALGISTRVFAAYTTETTTVNLDCDKGIDVLTGVNGANLLNSTAAVTNSYAAIDADPTYATYATLNTGLQAINEVFLTAIFAKASQPLDSVKIVYDGGGGLNLLSGFTIQPYLENTAVGGAFGTTNVTVKPVAGSATKFEISFPVAASFDRVKISWGGLLAVGTEMHIYNVTKVLPKPQPLINGEATDIKEICFGKPNILSVANQQSCTTYNWYTSLNATTPVYTGPSYDPGELSVGQHIYYVESRRDNCLSSVSERVKIILNINPLPTVSVTDASTCAGTAAQLSVNNPQSGISYLWYDALTGGNLLFTGNTYTTAVLNADKTYYVESVNQTTGCVSAARQPLKVLVKPYATIGITSGAGQVCVGESIALSNTVSGGYWTSSDAGIATVDATGLVTGKATGTISILYTINATATTCANSVAFPVQVNALPDLALGTVPEICSGFNMSALTYSNAVNNPISYSITWADVNFSSITNATLPAGNIPFTLPANIAAGSYSGMLTIKNANGCSRTMPFTIHIVQKPAAPHVLLNTSSQY
ncbi:Ig-like domain-containing protein [Pedobacter sp. AW1-32]|uniref:Ig-like domain-containing protein n=1 Tax=Pedobacter sp. AW1-32 TaxID=3383026 RepID=UPI003FF1121A